MEHRKKVAVMMRDFLHVQEELLVQAQHNLEVSNHKLINNNGFNFLPSQEYQEKLVKVYNVRQELQSHIQNLPDLTQLPNVTDGLAPLPSAENLFMHH